MADDSITTEDSSHNHGHIEQVDLQGEMQRSYLDYAMAVIIGRALPDVRDGLKPVHRRVIYAMYDGGYRPDKSFSKCARVVGEVMGQYHPHGDTAIYDTLVRLVQPWALRYPLALGQGNFGSPGNMGAAAPRYTETKMAPLALEMVRDIEEETVDFTDNYDGQTQEPAVMPARFPNLLVNGSVGIAVGMATNIPPHNLREVAEGALWALEHPEATREELLEALMQRIKGPDFPTGAQILGTRGIHEAYRTGRGSITMRAVVEIAEIQGRTCLVITELPYQVNPDNLALKIADLARDGKISGHRRHPRRDIGTHGSATRDRSEAGCCRQGRAEQPVQAHAAAGELRREHARDRRRRAAHAVARRLHLALGRPPDRRHRPPDAVPAARGREAHAHPARVPQGARRTGRGHRPHPPVADRRRGALRASSRSSRSTTSRPTPSSRCSSAASPRSSARRSSTRPPSSRRRSPTTATSSPSPSVSA